jgi:hypothetical protein
MVDRAQGRKKSDFVAKSTVDAGAYMDYFVNGTNYKITYANFLGGLGVTGSIEQDGDPTGTAVLDIDGTVNKIRNIENGAGILASVSAQNGVEIKHNFSADSTGSPLLLNVTDATPDIASLVGGNGINVTSTSNYTIDAEAQPYAQVSVQGNTGATTISTAGTPVKASATFVVGIQSGFTGDTTGKIVYNGTSARVAAVHVSATFSPVASNNQEVFIQVAKNGTVEAGSKITRKVDAAESANASTFFNVSLAQNDFIELYIGNDTSTDDVVLIDAIVGIVN